MASINQEELKDKVKMMYKEVAENPKGEFHFEMGRDLAEKLGYSVQDLDKVPSEAVDSFAGVGHVFDLTNIEEGESVLDLGSGSGMDSFISALKVGNNGKVLGIEMTDEQLEKSRTLGSEFQMVSFKKGLIEELPLEDESFDLVISNGVINLMVDKEKVFKEISRVLKPGGRMAISDIVTEDQLTEEIVENTTLWASCIGGATQEDKYKKIIESANMKIIKIIDNPQYNFISDSAKGATETFGVKSVSILAEKPHSE
jgi:SAM-dependent methyltransferase